jgi:hypothetical protein
MNIIIQTTQTELDSMALSPEELQELVLQRLDSTKRSHLKIFWQVELSTEVKVN